MFPFLLLAVSMLPAQQVSLDCADTGVNIATTQTQPVRGPAGSSAVLKVSSSDDYAKDSHLCEADYQLLITSAPGAAPATVDFLASDGDYGRSLSLRLDGFSQNGRRILGILAEGGKTPSTLLFNYHGSDSPVQLVDLAKHFAPVMNAACIRTLDVIGTTSSGTLVLETNSATPCASAARWLLDAAGAKPRPLPQGAQFLPLYPPTGAAQ